ncbi:MAG: signal peptidase I [Planctomycetota bacterium]|jgi:signal peptidase I
MVDESIINTSNRRRPWLAVVLSLIMPGLGHTYSGRFPRGLVFLFVCFVPIMLLQAGRIFELFGPVLLGVVVLLTAAPLIHIVATIDSYYIARHTKPDYRMKDYNRWYVYVTLALLNTASSLDATLSLRANYLEAFRVPSASNYPTIVPNDRLIANKIVYNHSDPEKGDLVVFTNPENRNQNYIKRVVAVAGDTLEIKDGRLYINDRQIPHRELTESVLKSMRIEVNGEPLEGRAYCETNGDAQYTIFLARTAGDQAPPDFEKTTVPQHHCFVLGDNRNLSRDSRQFGPVPLATIKGRADYLYWPVEGWARFGTLRN